MESDVAMQTSVEDFRRRLARLAPEQRARLAQRLNGAPSAQDNRGGQDLRLVAYLVPAPGQPVALDELRGFLAERLPAYMLPAHFVVLDALPLTPNGKLDRQALPAPRAVPAADQDGFVAPRSPDEQAIADVWAGLLGVDTFSVYDNFFELGGHSLLVARMALQLRERFGMEIPVAMLFKNPTIAALAQWVQAARWAAQGVQSKAALPAGEWDEIEL